MLFTTSIVVLLLLRLTIRTVFSGQRLHTLSRTLPGGCGRGTVVTVRDLRSGARSGRFGPGRARLCAVSAVALRLGSRSAGRALSRSGGGDLSHAGT